jgi:NAD(P)H-nitrite reductase large subunit
LPGVQGLYDLRDLSRLYENVKTVRRAVIVGGGLIGIELAEMLRSREIDISFVVREASYWNNVLPAEESAMVNRLIRHHGMELLLESELDRIEEGSDGRVCAVVTKDGHSIECQFVGLTAGVSPNIGLAKEAGLTVGRGIQVDRSLRTSNENIWAAGDCAEIVTEGEGRNLIQQVWYTGREQGDIAGDTIAGIERNHHPGIWYNSAKFLDLEYQTYGRVNLSLEDEENLFWSHENSMHAVRIVHVAGVVIGFNFMGWRARHRVCERWIAQSASVEHVLASLDEASFDPEFFEKMANQALPELQAQWRRRGAEAKA